MLGCYVVFLISLTINSSSSSSNILLLHHCWRYQQQQQWLVDWEEEWDEVAAAATVVEEEENDWLLLLLFPILLHRSPTEGRRGSRWMVLRVVSLLGWMMTCTDYHWPSVAEVSWRVHCSSSSVFSEAFLRRAPRAKLRLLQTALVTIVMFLQHGVKCLFGFYHVPT